MDSYSFNEHPGFYAGKHPVAADTIVSDGGLVAVNSAGNALDADSTVTGFVVGRSEGGADNSGGAAGDVSVLVKKGCFALQLAAVNPPTKAHVGKIVYATAPDTVAHTGTCRAGKLIGFDADGLAIVDTAFAKTGGQVTLQSTNGTAGAAADLAALKAETEKLGDDLRAIHAELVNQGTLLA